MSEERSEVAGNQSHGPDGGDHDDSPVTACVGNDCCQVEGSCDADHARVEYDCQGDSLSSYSEESTCCGSVERCDEKCIFTAAVLECAKACDNHEENNNQNNKQLPHEHSVTGAHSDSACNSHLRSAFDKYASYIEQARCICRSIVSTGLASPSSCCKPPLSNKTAAHSAVSGNTKGTPEGGMSTGFMQPHREDHHRHRHRQHRGHHQHDDGQAGTSNGRNNNMQASDEELHDAVEEHGGHGSHCHGDGPHHHHVHGHGSNHGVGSCCDTGATNTPDFTRSENFDLEKSADHELVSIAITGMDCTSCADKLTRVLLSTDGVSQARINFISGRGEFTIDTTITDADRAVRLAASGSGFRLTRILGGDHYLDVCVSPEAAKELSRQPPVGVTDVHILDKRTLRLSYDPASMGARALYESIHNKWPLTLAPSRADPQVETIRRRLLEQGIKTGLALFFTIPVVTFAWGHDLIDKKTKAIVSVALATLVQLIAIPEFYRPALSTLFYSKMVEMDMLVVISITAAYIYSIVAFGFQMAGRPLGTSEFFETSTLLITFILFGRVISTFARFKATDAVSIRSNQPSTAVLAEQGHDREIDARLLQYGDQFRLLPHSRVPTDGTIVQGTTEIDESMLTGEAMPVLKRVGDGVIAGTVNGDGTVLVQLERLPGKNTVTDIARLVDQAADKKPKIQDLADKVAGWFVPMVSTVSLIVLVVWIAVGLKVLNYSTSAAVLEAITYFVATLAVACPCALGLAVPMVSIVAGGIAARGGVIIKSAETTERARTTTDVIFDKTGTITESELAVVEEKYISDDKDMAIVLTKALVAGGKHPVSAAISKYLSDNSKGNARDVSDIRVVPGAGILANLDGRVLRAGHPRWTGTDAHPAVKSLEAEGRTILVVTLDSDPLIAFGLKAQIRPEAARIIAELKACNIRVHLVSGDHTKAVQSVAQAVDIPEENTAAERLPSQKQDYVASIMQDPSRYVIFCGDGTNDAGAVAEAHVGVQINSSLTGSDVTQNASDVILLNGLEGVVTLLNVSQAAFNRMVFNFVWSAIYNVLAITLASGAWVRFRIPPAYAGLAELVSVLPVIAAAVTLFLVDLKHKIDAY